eukprot:3268478-Amphidinium_carterae.1
MNPGGMVLQKNKLATDSPSVQQTVQACIDVQPPIVIGQVRFGRAPDSLWIELANSADIESAAGAASSISS